MSFAAALARWSSSLRFEDLPDDVVEATKLRVLDIIGLTLAGACTPIGRAAREAAVALSPQGPCTILGTSETVGVTFAALANGTCSQALEYDDTHNESIVHMSSPSVAAALALSEIRPVTGRDFITAVALSNEIACRAGSVASGQFHKRGFHPTGLFAAFGTTCLAARLLELDAETTAHALGICGSVASGILQCWVDGTDTKFLHAGWAAQAGVTAAHLARAGASGPFEVFEGRFGFFAAHLQQPDRSPDFDRLTRGLGTHWESRNASFKPYPAAHVIHPYIDAVLHLREAHAISAQQVARIDCPVAPFIVGIVCEPVEEKVAPRTQSHCRVSLQYTLAEALTRGRLGRDAYGDESRTNADVLALARRVHYHPDPSYPGPGRFKGAVTITLTDGRTFEKVQEHNRGSAENPMTPGELRAKFDDNATLLLEKEARAALADAIDRLPLLREARILALLARPPHHR